MICIVGCFWSCYVYIFRMTVHFFLWCVWWKITSVNIGWWEMVFDMPRGKIEVLMNYCDNWLWCACLKMWVIFLFLILVFSLKLLKLLPLIRFAPSKLQHNSDGLQHAVYNANVYITELCFFYAESGRWGYSCIAFEWKYLICIFLYLKALSLLMTLLIQLK